MNTGRHGEYVAGVRYRAWAPPSALHPTIGVHSPLVFDLIDTWNGRSIGGCSYHVSHPGGRSYDNYPINAHEAESRRVNRFDTTSHSYQQTNVHPRPTSDTDTVRDFFANTAASAMEPPVDEFTGEYPYTLDLRRKPSKI